VENVVTDGGKGAAIPRPRQSAPHPRLCQGTELSTVRRAPKQAQGAHDQLFWYTFASPHDVWRWAIGSSLPALLSATFQALGRARSLRFPVIKVSLSLTCHKQLLLSFSTRISTLWCSGELQLWGALVEWIERCSNVSAYGEYYALWLILATRFELKCHSRSSRWIREWTKPASLCATYRPSKPYPHDGVMVFSPISLQGPGATRGVLTRAPRSVPSSLRYRGETSGTCAIQSLMHWGVKEVASILYLSIDEGLRAEAANRQVHTDGDVH